MVFCTGCGRQLHETAMACPGCGAPNAPVVVPPAAAQSQGLLIGGCVAALVMPPIGFVIGIVLLTKGRVGHGIGAMVLSVFMFFFWGGFIPAFTKGFQEGYSHASE